MEPNEEPAAPVEAPQEAPVEEVSAVGQIEESLASIPEWLEGYLLEWGLGDYADVTSRVLILIGVVLVAMLAHFVARNVLVGIMRAIVRKTETEWDDALIEQKVFLRLAHIVPALAMYFGAPLIFPSDFWAGALQRISLAYMVLTGGMALSSVMNAIVQVYEKAYRGARELPIQTTLQVVKIVMWLFAVILIAALLMDRSPWAFLGGLGAMTAVLLLVFKDTILGFVASIQITAHDMVRKGDWIEMPQYNADGDVVDISLTTVKVQNWDKTISTIPTYALVSNAFKNWRGMSESGGRRIKRSLLIDIDSVRFVDDELMAKLQKVELLRDYLASKADEVSKWNTERNVDPSSLVNGRHLTNLGTFRAYVAAYLQAHPEIDHKNMTFLVRQLAPDEKGVPIQIYCFSKEQRWVMYEGIQSDLFDHFLASLHEFELRAVQIPTGHDLQQIASART